MKVIIEITCCQDCPYSEYGDNKIPHQTYICTKLSDNIGPGDTIPDNCPLKK